MTDQEKIEKLRKALKALVIECQTNQDFANVHESEVKALDFAEDVLEETK